MAVSPAFYSLSFFQNHQIILLALQKREEALAERRRQLELEKQANQVDVLLKPESGWNRSKIRRFQWKIQIKDSEEKLQEQIKTLQMKLEEQRWAEVDYLVAAELHSKSELKKTLAWLKYQFWFLMSFRSFHNQTETGLEVEIHRMVLQVTFKCWYINILRKSHN